MQPSSIHSQPFQLRPQSGSTQNSHINSFHHIPLSSAQVQRLDGWKINKSSFPSRMNPQMNPNSFQSRNHGNMRSPETPRHQAYNQINLFSSSPSHEIFHSNPLKTQPMRNLAENSPVSMTTGTRGPAGIIVPYHQVAEAVIIPPIRNRKDYVVFAHLRPRPHPYIITASSLSPATPSTKRQPKKSPFIEKNYVVDGSPSSRHKSILKSKNSALIRIRAYCHQCGYGSKSTRYKCKSPGCRLSFCQRCLTNLYGTTFALYPDHRFCPKCVGICFCRKCNFKPCKVKDSDMVNLDVPQVNSSKPIVQSGLMDEKMHDHDVIMVKPDPDRNNMHENKVVTVDDTLRIDPALASTSHVKRKYTRKVSISLDSENNVQKKEKKSPIRHNNSNKKKTLRTETPTYDIIEVDMVKMKKRSREQQKKPKEVANTSEIIIKESTPKNNKQKQLKSSSKTPKKQVCSERKITVEKNGVTLTLSTKKPLPAIIDASDEAIKTFLEKQIDAISHKLVDSVPVILSMQSTPSLKNDNTSEESRSTTGEVENERDDADFLSPACVLDDDVKRQRKASQVLYSPNDSFFLDPPSAVISTDLEDVFYSDLNGSMGWDTDRSIF